MRVWLRIIVGGIALWTALELPAAARDKRDDAVTREKMGQIFQSVHALLPLTATPKAFRDPKRQPEIYVALRALANDASALAEHIQEQDRGAGFLGHSFARGARETLRQYDQGRYDSAEFRIQRMTEYCIACHARLASPRDSPLAADFIDETALSAMSLQERARIQIATRRFDDALTTLEQIFASPSIHPAEMLDPMTNYLIVCIRVRGDFERPLPTWTGIRCAKSLRPCEMQRKGAPNPCWCWTRHTFPLLKMPGTPGHCWSWVTSSCCAP